MCHSMILPLLLYVPFMLQVSSQYLPDASVAWRRQLQGRMRRGNGMAFTKNGLLVATTDNGGLHILKGDAFISYLPTSVIEGTLFCKSKPVLASPDMAIYTVSNYVLAVNLTDATTIWSTSVEETIMGSPAVSRRGQSVYVTHNQGNTGYVSVLRLQTGERLAALEGSVPFGPPTVLYTTSTASDAVFFGDATDNGFSTGFANLYALLWDSREHANRNGQGERSYDLIVAATGVRATSVAPAVENDYSLYLGTQGSMVFGFDFGDQANLLDERSRATAWTAVLDLDRSNFMAPIPTTPIVTPDSLFVTAAGNHISSIAISGKAAGWDDRTINSPVYAQPIYFNDRSSFPVLYFAERNGIVYQKDARSGTTKWTLDVDSSVEADMIVSDNGNLLYVGDTSGNVVALKVAGNPTTAPTDVPATLVPTIAPTVRQTGAPVVTDPETSVPDTNDPDPDPDMKDPGTKDPETNVPAVAPVDVAPTVSTSNPVDATITMTPQQQPTIVSNSQDQDKSSQSAKEESFLASNMYFLAAGGVLIILALLFLFLICARRRRHGRKNQQMAKSGDSTAVEERMDDLEQQAYEKECAENERATLMDIASTPIKADRARSIGSWDSGNVSGTPHTLASIEESPERNDGKITDDDKSVGYEVAMDRSISEYTGTARSLDGVMSEVDDEANEDPIVGKMSKGIPATLAESTEALALAVGAAVAAISSSEEKKETESVSSRGSIALRRVKSTETDFSTPTQPGRIRSEKSRPKSPSDMMSVDSSSIYLDEPSIHSMDRVQSVAKNSAVEDAVVGKAAPAPKECPEDEGRGILRPGSAYLSRHNEKKTDEPKLSIEGVRTRSAPGSNGPDRLQPMYNGVSVRPAGRSRAGIFSRRQPQLTTFTDDEEEPEPSSQLPVKLGPKRSELLRSQRPEIVEGEPRFTAHGYYEEPVDISNIANIVSADSEDNPDPVKAGSSQKVSKANKRGSKQQPPPEGSPANKSSMSDPWGSFLSELSKVESSFFSTNGLLPGRDEDASVDEVTADEDNSAPPPAPRTFYA